MKSIYIFLSMCLLQCAFVTSAFACGGLFCDVNQPVVQAAERILFAPDHQDDAKMQMHVLLNYQGPPEEFSWLLPVPRDTEFSISSRQIFTVFDNRFAPIFSLNREGIGDCDQIARNSAPTAEFDGAAQEDSGVQVLSRESVGPYDKVTLTGGNIEEIIQWLTENGYQVPEGSEEVLSPYLENSVFLAIKLLPNEGSDDVEPVALTFTGTQATIPLRPTSVAATPDMGVIVHLLGNTRAIPTNFAHVEINELAIDWFNNGSNYADVVSQAADESDGHAFVTDFAGAHNLGEPLFIVSDSVIEEIESARTIEELVAINEYWSIVNDPEYQAELMDRAGLDQDQMNCFFGGCPQEENLEVDGAAIAMGLADINKRRENIQALLEQHPYITRLYTTLSASEMTLDPVFDFNSDLEDVEQTRTATLVFTCDDGENLSLTTPSGQQLDLQENELNPIARQDGETVRGMDNPGAAVIMQQMPSGQPEVITDNRPMLEERFASQSNNQAISDDDGLFGCSQDTNRSSAPLWIIALLGLITVTQRRVKISA